MQSSKEYLIFGCLYKAEKCSYEFPLSFHGQLLQDEDAFI